MAERATNLKNIFSLQMSSRYVRPTLSAKNRNLDWINCIVQVHNLQCQCDTPLEHTVEEILIQEPNLQFNKPEKCLGTTKDLSTADVDAFGDGDLEKLFEQDFGEDAIEGTSTG